MKPHLLAILSSTWLISGAVAVAAEIEGPLLLRDPAGRMLEPLGKRGQKATVLLFLTTECPLGNRYAPEIARIAKDFGKRGVEFFAIYMGEKPAEVSRHLADYSLPLTALLDPTHSLAKRTGATVTPEACVINPQGELLYRGRIDNRAVKLGTVRPEPTVRDLRLALDAVLAGRPVPAKFTKAIGCYISPPAAVE